MEKGTIEFENGSKQFIPTEKPQMVNVLKNCRTCLNDLLFRVPEKFRKEIQKNLNDINEVLK